MYNATASRVVHSIITGRYIRKIISDINDLLSSDIY